MTASVCKKGGRVTAAGRFGPEGVRRTAPRAVLAGPALPDTIADQLRARGWDVRTAATPAEAAALAVETNPTAVVLPAEADGESGYLVCAKLRRARPRVRLVLVGETRTDRDARLARFVGATLVAGAAAADAVIGLG
ncbi:MAG: hypothetical protein K2P78_14670 [Gemmataceae bacterium]|nr:hypothetical protein [Gemmataceae bacterium]